MEIIFNAGEKFQRAPLVAKATAAQLSEGTVEFPSKDFSHLLEKTGAS
jgi:hypothetical protein